MKNFNFDRIDKTIRISLLVLIAGLCIGLPLHAITKSRIGDEMDAFGTARKPLVMIAGQTQGIPDVDYALIPGGISLNGTAAAAGIAEGTSARFVEASGADNNTVLVGSYTGTNRTADKLVTEGSCTGSFDATGASRLCTPVIGVCATSRSAGANPVICATLTGQATPSAGVINYFAMNNDPALPSVIDGFVGFGVPQPFSPRRPVHIFGDQNDPGPAGTIVQSTGAEELISSQTGTIGAELLVVVSNATSTPLIQGVRARGTFGAPTALNDGDAALAFLSKLYDGAGTAQATAGVEFSADGAQGAASTPQRIDLSTGATNSASRTPRIRIGATGLVDVTSRVTSSGTGPTPVCDGGTPTPAVTGGEWKGTVNIGVDSTTCALTFAHNIQSCNVTFQIPRCSLITGACNTYDYAGAVVTVTAAAANALSKIDYDCAAAN